MGVAIDDADVQAVVNVYANKLGDIEYLRFLSDCDVLSYVINEAFTGAKSTYRNTNIDFNGSRVNDPLMRKKRKHFRRRAAIEPVIEHLKSDHRAARNFLKGQIGDQINFIMAAAGFNYKKLMIKLKEKALWLKT